MSRDEKYINTRQYGESKIFYNGYTYKLSEEMIDFAKSVTVGKAKTYMYFSEAKGAAQYMIENERLYLTSFMCLMDDDDADKILPEFRDKSKLSFGTRRFLESGGFKEQRVIELLFKDMQITYPYSGELHAHQYYPDEVQTSGKTHLEEDVFVFLNGCLDTDKSRIKTRDELFITQYTWQDGKDCQSRSGAYSSDDTKVFFLDPIGTYIQQDEVFSRCVNYVAHHQIGKDLITDLFKYKKPVLRAEMMFQKKSGSREYYKRVFDLPLLAVRFLDSNILALMYDHIQFDDYPEYPQWILDELFSKWHKMSKELGVSKYVCMLELLVSKGLKCKNAENYISLVRSDSTLASHDAEVLIGLLDKLI